MIPSGGRRKPNEEDLQEVPGPWVLGVGDGGPFTAPRPLQAMERKSLKDGGADPALLPQVCDHEPVFHWWC